MPGKLTIKSISANLKRSTDIYKKMDPYCVFKIGELCYKTAVLPNAGQTPQWNDVLSFDINEENFLIIEIFDQDAMSEDLVASGKYSLKSIFIRGKKFETIPLYFEDEDAGAIKLELVYQGEKTNKSGGVTTQQNVTNATQNMMISNVPLFSLDVNYDSLKNFLDNIINIVNQHANLINDLQEEVGEKSSTKQLCNSLVRNAECIEIYDNSFNKYLQSQIERPKAEKTGFLVDDSANKMCNKMSLVSNALTYFYHQDKNKEERIKILEKEMKERVKTSAYKEKNKKLKKSIFTEFEDLKRNTTKSLDDIEERLTKQIMTFEESVQDCERKTFWRIQDCEELLKKRINNDYVDMSLKLLEDKFVKEVANLTGGGQEKMLRIEGELLSRMKIIEDTFGEKLKNNKKMIKDFEEFKIVLTDNYKIDKQVNNDKHNDLLTKIKNLEKNDLTSTIQRQAAQIKALEGTFIELNDTISSKLREMNSKMIEFESVRPSPGNNTNLQNVGYGMIDPHKLCGLESDIKRVENDVTEHKHIIHSLQETIRSKLDKFDNDYVSNLIQDMNFSSAEKLTKEDVIKLIELHGQNNKYSNGNGHSMDEDKLRKIQKDILELFRRSEFSQELDQKISRIFRELDINNLVKTIKTKADQTDLKKEVAILETKINSLYDNLGFVRKEIEHVYVILRKNPAPSHTTHIEQINTVLSTKRLYPVQCLSCGLKGKDGRYYQTSKPKNFFNANSTNPNASNLPQNIPENEPFIPYNEQEEMYFNTKNEKSESVIGKNRPSSTKAVQNKLMRPGSAKK